MATPHLPTVDEIKGEICEALEQDSEHRFACFEVLPGTVNPQLFLRDYGSIELPLSPNDANAIISKGSLSPFGKGSETIIDTNIRKSWQLDPSEFSLQQPEWDQAVSRMLDRVHEGLEMNCSRQNVTAQLYKLLLYEEGAFFKAHQDSEKTPGMFGTLVICLPSTHAGGEIILTHNDQTQEFKTSIHSESAITFAAWYSDVLHEIKPITSGYRLVLTYNLVKDADSPVEPPLFAFSKHRLLTALNQYDSSTSIGEEDKCPPFLIHKLEHQYTQASLCANLLKGKDHRQTQCLHVVAEELGFSLYLATLEKEIIKEDDEDQYNDPTCEWDEEEEDDEEDEEDMYEGYGGRIGGYIGDHTGGGPRPNSEQVAEYAEIDRNLRLIHVVALDGQRVNIDNSSDEVSGVKIQEDSLFDPDAFDEDDPDDEDHSGYTGNEGCTASFYYRDTVLVIVPRSKRVKFLYDCDHRPEKMLSLIGQLRSNADAGPAARRDLAEMCALLFAEQSRSYSYIYQDKMNPQLVQELVVATLEAERLDFFEKGIRLLSGAPLPPDAFIQLGRLMASMGEEKLRQRIEGLVKNTSLAVEFAALERVKTGFINAAAAIEDGETKRVWFDTWFTEAITCRVRDGGARLKIDAVTLANIVTGWKVEDVEKWVVPKLLGSNSQPVVKVAFADHLMKLSKAVPFPGSELENGGDARHLSTLDCIRISEQIIADLWNDLRFDVETQDLVYCGGMTRSFDMPIEDMSRKYDQCLLDGADLADLLQHTRNLDILTEEEIHRRLDAAALSAGPEAVLNTLLPFVRLVLGGKVVCFEPRVSVNRPSRRAVQFVTRVLAHYVNVCLGAEPRPPPDWSRPTANFRCPCGDCMHIKRFLANPNERVGRFPCGRVRRRHLDSEFTSHSDREYTVESIVGRKPETWLITKTTREYDNAHRAWKRKHVDAGQRMAALKRTGSLEMYLIDEVAAGIMSLDAYAVARHHSLIFGPEPHAATINTSRPPLQATGANTMPFTLSSAAGVKRSMEEDSENAGMKRVRSTTEENVSRRARPVEIIDLT